MRAFLQTTKHGPYSATASPLYSEEKCVTLVRSRRTNVVTPRVAAVTNYLGNATMLSFSADLRGIFRWRRNQPIVSVPAKPVQIVEEAQTT